MPTWHAAPHSYTNKQGTRCNTTAADLTKIQLCLVPSEYGKNVPLNEKSSTEEQLQPSQVCTMTWNNTPSLTYDFIGKKSACQSISLLIGNSALYCSFCTDLNSGCLLELVWSQSLLGSGSLSEITSQMSYLWLNHQCLDGGGCWLLIYIMRL